MIIIDGSEIKDEENICLTGKDIRECTVSSHLIKWLSISRNSLTSFEIQAPNIGELYLFKNHLTSFEIQAPNLKKLNLSDNNLIRFEIQAPNLEVLYLFNNHLTSFGIQAPNLKKLNLDNNCLTSFEIQAPNLKELYLSHNPLRILSLQGYQVPKLVRLDLIGTQVKFVSAPFVKLTNLQERTHALGLIEIIEITFYPKGHPIAEAICENIQV